MLRKQHQLEEKVEQKAIEDALEMEAAAKAKQAAKKRSLKETTTAAAGKLRSKAAKKAGAAAKRRLQGTSSASQFQRLPPVLTPKIGGWVAVAYENGWFPGHVLEADEETETYYTTFLHPCSIAGQYKHPHRADQADVRKRFIFAAQIQPPVPASGGRIFILPDNTTLAQQYCLCRKRYLCIDKNHEKLLRIETNNKKTEKRSYSCFFNVSYSFTLCYSVHACFCKCC